MHLNTKLMQLVLCFRYSSFHMGINFSRIWFSKFYEKEEKGNKENRELAWGEKKLVYRYSILFHEFFF